MLQFHAADGLIDLAWGDPAPELLAAPLIARATVDALARHGPHALGYGAHAGPPPLLDWLRDHLGRIDGRAPGDGELMITAGVSQGLDLALTMLTHPGDTVLVPVPSYHLALRILREHPVRIEPVDSDEDGALPDAIAAAAARVLAAGGRPRLLYLVPTSGNPTGITLSLERRRAVLAAAAATDTLIVEDDVYRELAYDAPAPPSLWSLGEPGRVLRLGSASKTLAPGLRVGWLTADAATVTALVDSGIVDSGGGVAHFSGTIVAELGRSGAYLENLGSVRTSLTERRDALVGALRQHVPDAAFRVPAGGYFAWLRLPDGLDARALQPIAERHGVGFVPGDRFTAGTDHGRDRLRLAFSRYPAEQLQEAARRLGSAVTEALAARR